MCVDCGGVGKKKKKSTSFLMCVFLAPKKKKKRKKMALRVTCSKKPAVVKNVHLLPFSVVVPAGGDDLQPAPVSAYFVVNERPDGVLESAFRGRQVRGKRAALPDGFVGAVMKVERVAVKKRKSLDDDDDDEDGERQDAERKGAVTGVFESFVVWNHDSVPADNENPFEWLKWPVLAAAVHRPVSAEEVAQRTENEPAL